MTITGDLRFLRLKTKRTKAKLNKENDALGYF